jgi:hypothetical protein
VTTWRSISEKLRANARSRSRKVGSGSSAKPAGLEFSRLRNVVDCSRSSQFTSIAVESKSRIVSGHGCVFCRRSRKRCRRALVIA